MNGGWICVGSEAEVCLNKNTWVRVHHAAGAGGAGTRTEVSQNQRNEKVREDTHKLVVVDLRSLPATVAHRHPRTHLTRYHKQQPNLVQLWVRLQSHVRNVGGWRGNDGTYFAAPSNHQS